MSIVRTSLFARFLDPSAASELFPFKDDFDVEKLLSTEDVLLSIAVENHDPLREYFLFSCCMCRAWIGDEVMCRVNLSRLSVRYCRFGWPLAKTRITGMPCCRAGGTSTRFRARLNLDLRVCCCFASEGVPTVFPLAKEARGVGTGADS